jgi:hypothetical protein
LPTTSSSSITSTPRLLVFVTSIFHSNGNAADQEGRGKVSPMRTPHRQGNPAWYVSL